MDSHLVGRFARTQELLLVALHAAQLGAWETDLTTGENVWHEGMAHLLGVPADRAPAESKRFVEYVHPDDRAKVEAAYAEAVRAAQPGRMFDMDFRVIRMDGAVRWFNSRGMEIETADGQRRIVGVAQDITERKAWEEQLGEQAQLIELSHDAIVVRTLDARIRTWNSGAEQLYGFRRDEAVGAIMHHLLRTEFPAPLEEIEQQLVRDGRWSGELVHTRRDGTRVVVTTRWTLNRDVEGRPRHVLESNTDITERKAYERRLEETQAALHEADRRKNEFLATLAHELRNPLAPIRNAAQMLRQPSLGESRHRTAVDILERQVRHMVRLVDDLLDVGRITSGKLHLVRERVELASVIEHAIEASRPFDGHHFSVSLPPHPVYVDGDPVRLTQVFSNLLANAVKYTPKGAAIGMVGEERDGLVVVKVSDEGIGVAPEELARLFDMFAQVESPLHRLHGGLGVGLALARVFVELHGGSIEAHSEGSGKGTQFTVRLPIATGSVQSTGP